VWLGHRRRRSRSPRRRPFKEENITFSFSGDKTARLDEAPTDLPGFDAFWS
jgi:hypothetical protein